jgi:hypothetical protein
VSRLDEIRARADLAMAVHWDGPWALCELVDHDIPWLLALVDEARELLDEALANDDITSRQWDASRDAWLSKVGKEPDA